MKKRTWALTALILTLALLFSAILIAQPGRELVQVIVTGNPNEPLQVTPNRANICINDNNCPGQARWRLVGQPNAGQSVEIRSSQQCFSQSTFQLTRDGEEVDSGAPTCAAGTVWVYDAVLVENGQDLSVFDPELVIGP